MTGSVPPNEIGILPALLRLLHQRAAFGSKDPHDPIAAADSDMNFIWRHYHDANESAAAIELVNESPFLHVVETDLPIAGARNELVLVMQNRQNSNPADSVGNFRCASVGQRHAANFPISSTGKSVGSHLVEVQT